jgi:siderophore synthetase component
MPTPTIVPTRRVDTDRSGATAVSADHVVVHTLVNCFTREVPGRTELADDQLYLRLSRSRLRIAVRRTSLSGAHRFTGPVFAERDGAWTALTWRDTAAALAAELTAVTGVANDEFVDQVAGSHAVTATALRDRTTVDDRYLASEQALSLGHRFHPTPKSRTAASGDWRAYAPETGSRFPLRYLAVRADRIREATVPGADLPLDRLRPVPAGHRLLPVHPWQYDLMRHNEKLTAALRDRVVIDLGAGGPLCTPTSSVRTVHCDGDFLKFSLNVRITNCVRKNSAYELASAVALTELLDTELADLPVRFPGAALLREPGYRTLDVGSPELFEAFGVIVREGLSRCLLPGVTPLLAAAVADEYPLSDAHVSRLVSDVGLLDWWHTYLRLLLPPVLAAFFDHGVVLEPHLQNVLVGVSDAGMPVQMLFRDMEGTKLLAEHHAGALAALPADVAEPLTYTREQGWRRVAYCLLVNHVAEVLAALADLRPDLEPELWSLVADQLARCHDRHGRPAELGAVLAGGPVPAKANLLVRWQRGNDRLAGYVPLRLPLRAR